MRKFIFLILFLIFSISIYAFDDYYYGNYENGKSTEQGIWNHELDSEDVTHVTRGASDPRYHPVWGDIDNDGVQEVIIVKRNAISIYEGQTLNVDDGITIDDTSSPVWLQDLDNNNLIDMIFVTNGDKRLWIVEFNGTDTEIKLNTTLASTFTENWTYSTVACNAQNNCLANIHYDSFGYQHVYIGFNESGSIGSLNTSDFSTPRCPNTIFSITPADVTSDIGEEFVISYQAHDVSGTNDGFWVLTFSLLDVVGSLVPVEETSAQIKYATGSYRSSGGNQYCSRSYIEANEKSKLAVTNPIIMDFDGDNDLEIVVASLVNAEEYRIYSFDTEGNFEKSYPEYLGISVNADGSQLSNLIRMDADGNPANDEVCVFALDEVDQSNQGDPTVLCASEEGSYFDGEEYTISVDKLPYNMTDVELREWRHFYTMIHAGDYNQTSSRDEIITMYGVMQLYPNTLPLSQGDMRIDWAITKDKGNVIPIDIENVGISDLGILTDTNYWIANDGFSNSDCSEQTCITEVTTNPSINQIIKVNTTFHVTVTLTDVDSDLLNARVIIYDGLGNEQDTGWSANVTSGSTVSFTTLKVNQTVNNAPMTVQARESGNPSAIEELNFVFSVSEEGVEFGESTFTYTGEVDDADDVTVDGEDTAITALMSDLSDETNMGYTSIWLILMALVPVIAVVLLIQNGAHGTKDLTSIFAIVGVIELFLLVLGVRFGFIGIVWVITLAVLSMVFAGIWVAKHFFMRSE